MQLHSDDIRRLAANWLVSIAVLGITTVAIISAVDSAIAKTTISLSATVPADGSERSGAPGLIIFSDFQCPSCKKFAPEMRTIESTFHDRITFEFKNYPLPQHKNAMAAALAAEAAAKQGKFGPMHDVLFAKQDEWSTVSDPQPRFLSYANSLALNSKQFLADFNSPVAKNKIAADMKAGDAAGLEVTPSAIFNGTRYSGRDLRKLSGIIDGTINKTTER